MKKRAVTGIYSLREWGLVACLSVLGLMVNFLSVELFFNVDFIFGGVFVMLAVKYYGKKGIIAGFTASLYTYYLWNHPYAVIIFTAEAVFVAFMLKEGRDIILMDLLYWFTLGAGTVLVTYHFVMGLSMEKTLLVMLKQSVNGVFNALAASLIYYSINYIKKTAGREYRQVYIKHVFFKLLVLTAAVPALVYVIVMERHHWRDISSDYKVHLISMHEAAGASADAFFDEAGLHAQTLAARAEADGGEGAVLKESIKNQLASFPVFKGLAYVRKDFSADLVFLKKEGGIKAVSGIDFSNRNYFSEAAASRGLFLTDMHSCDGANLPDVITAVLPVRDKNDSVIGFIHGGIDAQVLKKSLLKISGSSGVMFTITDREGRIVLSTNPLYDGIDRYSDARSAGNLSDTGDRVSLWTPDPGRNVSVMARWAGSYYIKSGLVSAGMPYRLISELPLDAYVEKAGREGLNALAVIMGMILVSVLSAWIFSRRVAFHITKLSENTADLPEKVSRNEQFGWEPSVFVEVSRLTQNIKTMGERLTDSFNRLKQQADELTLVLNAIPLIIFVKDTRNNILMGNRAAADCFGIPQDRMLNLPVSELMHQPDVYYEDDLIAIRTGQPVRKIIQKYYTASGTRTVMTDKIPIAGRGGVVESILVISVDVTEELKQQEEKTKTLESLYQQSKMAELGAMIGAIAHQWKQPLNSIGLLAQVMQSDIEDKVSTDESMQENISAIMDNVRFMSQTVDDFSGFYKRDKEMTVFRACETMQEIYALLDRQFIKAGIEVVVHEHEHFEVYGLRNEFKQVCLNILINAKESLAESDIHEKRVEISYTNTLTTGIITVSDNGGGIPEELLPDRLFEMNITTKSDGTGIGLYICREIVEKHMGGTIAVRNTREGAEFTITLPLHNTMFS